MTKISRAVFILVLCAGSALLGSCQRPLQIWVVPGSTSDEVVFGLAESRKREESVRLSSILVFTCEAMKEGKGEMPNVSRSLWYAHVPVEETSERTTRITYGREEHGLVTRRGPSPLSAGCYVVIAYAHDQRNTLRMAAMRFEIGRDGVVAAK